LIQDTSGVTIVLATDIAAETPADANKKRRFAVSLALAALVASAAKL
jgi:hypothetical protein